MTTSAVILGTAIGDALGQPFETKRWDDPALLAWDGYSYGISTWHKLQPGQYTDDTAMTIALAESLLENKGYNPRATANKYYKWSIGSMFRGAGGTTKKAMERLRKGVEWFESGELGMFGNGTAMRISPIGVVKSLRDPQMLIRAAKLDAMITHNNHEAQQAAIAIACAVAELLNGVPKDDLLDKMRTYLEPSRVLNNINAIETNEIVSKTIRTDRTRLIERQLKVNAQLILGVGYTGIETCARALYCFLATDCFGEAMEVAIRGGGDTDTAAAITGALCGAYYGLEEIVKTPWGIENDHVNYLGQLENRDYILELDKKLIELDIL